MTITYHLANSQNNSILHQEHLEIGLKMEKLDISDQTKMVNDSITLMTLGNSLESQNQNLIIEKQSVMPVLVQTTKKKILKDKSNTSVKTIQMPQLLKILDQDSIGKDQDLIPFWKASTQEMSNKLWSPIETEYVDLDLNLLNGSLKKQMLNSWFSTKILIKKTSLESSQMTFLQSLQSLLPKIMDLEQEYIKGQEKKNNKKEKLDKPEAEKSIRIRIKFNKEQKKTLNKWFGVRRWIYNRCLHMINTGKAKKNMKDLREKVIKNENYKTENTWMLDNSDFDLRDEAMRDLLKNIKSNNEKSKTQGCKFKMKFKCKKDKNDSISVLGKKWNKNDNFYSSIFNIDNINSTEPLPKELKYTSRLKKSPLNKYYLCIPKPLGLQSENQAQGKMIFIDPGVKTFITGFDPSGKIIMWGVRDIAVIARLLHYKNKLQGRIKKEKTHKKRFTMKRALLRIYKRIENLISELHKKLAKWLCENYQYIFIPRLNFHKCKKLNSKSKAKMAAYSHCSFLNRLVNKSREYKKSFVLEVNEAFTSKTCSNCGNQHETLGNKDIYECLNCGITIGRDINASKNVMLRYFSQRAKLII